MSVNKNKSGDCGINGAEMSERHELLLKAYGLLSDVTPKKYDCGTLCLSLCCRENCSHGDCDSESGFGEQCGMILLPGEKELLSGAAEFEFFKTPDGGDMLVCNSSCVRELRPFACRIFPFYPKIEKCSGGYSIKILPDPRGIGICPIVRDFRKRKACAAFLRNAKKAVRILTGDDKILKELISQSEMITDIELLKEKLTAAKG